MKSFLKFLLIVAGILFLSVFLAPLLYRVLPFKFERIFNRLVMIFSLAAIFLFVRFRRETFERYGLTALSPENRRDLSIGFLAGIVTLAILAAVKIGLGYAFWRPEPLTFFNFCFQTLRWILAGLLIGLIEEFFFRGVIFQAFVYRLKWKLPVSVAVTSFFYSLVHFLSHKKPFVGPEPTWIDSLRLVAAPFQALQHWPEFWPEAAGLFLFGIILNLLVIQTKSLYPAIGLHAGCVFFVKMDGLFVDFLDAQNKIFFGSKKMYDGLIGWLFLLVMGWILSQIFKPRRFRG